MPFGTGYYGIEQDAPAGYRVDVVFDGALEGSEYFEDGTAALNYARNKEAELAAENPTDIWVVDVYDEGPEPPERIAFMTNEG